MPIQNDWVEKRMRGIAIRGELTDEWNKRGIKEGRNYAILTAEVSKAAFGMIPSEYRRFKKIKRENLRDHMNNLELVFSMLSEAATIKIAQNKDAQGFDENKTAAQKGGRVAGGARKQLEQETGERVSTRKNHLPRPCLKLRHLVEKSDILRPFDKLRASSLGINPLVK